MSEHRITLTWKRATPDFEYKTYSREHTATFKSKSKVSLSAAPIYGGNPNLPDPEDLLVAALSSCHMLSFMAIAAKRRFIVNSYDDDAIGFLERDSTGALSITRTTLRPRIAFEAGHAPDGKELDEMHHEAHQVCFIANSVKTQVTLEIEEPQHATT